MPPVVAVQFKVKPVKPPGLFGYQSIYVLMFAAWFIARIDQLAGVAFTTGVPVPVTEMSEKSVEPACVDAHEHTRLAGELVVLALPPGACTSVIVMLEAPH
jgi:hypothetical protein